MIPNARALVSRADEVVCDIDGREYRQAPFKYQGKCLQWIRERYADLTSADQNRVDQILADTGSRELLTADIEQG